MHCIFCECDTSTSRSVEHIVPESLGNKRHILPRGIVCDKCNNYFASKIEEPILSSLHFLNVRSRQGITNKLGLVPPQYGILPEAEIPIALSRSAGHEPSVRAWHERDNARFVRTLMSVSTGTLIIPFSMPVHERTLARLIAKIGFEAYAEKALATGITTEQIIRIEEFRSIRRFVRNGDLPKEWPINRRRIYSEDAIFSEENVEYNIIYEYMFLLEEGANIFFIICILGDEFAINLGEPSIDGYRRWLSANENRSPLYAL